MDKGQPTPKKIGLSILIGDIQGYHSTISFILK